MTINKLLYESIQHDDSWSIFQELIRVNDIGIYLKIFCIEPDHIRERCEILRKVLQHVDPSAEDNEVLCWAVNTRPEFVEILLSDPRVNPAAQNNRPLYNAANHDLDILRMLLKRKEVNPNERKREILVSVVKNGNISSVRELLADSRIGTLNLKAILEAGIGNHIDILRMLLRHTKLETSHKLFAYETLIRKNASDRVLQVFLRDEKLWENRKFSMNERNQDLWQKLLHDESEKVKIGSELLNKIGCDMARNVLEWVSDIYIETSAAISDSDEEIFARYWKRVLCFTS